MVDYDSSNCWTVDQWITYATRQASPEYGLELDLRLRRVKLCSRPCTLRGAGRAYGDQQEPFVFGEDATGAQAAGVHRPEGPLLLRGAALAFSRPLPSRAAGDHRAAVARDAGPGPRLRRGERRAPAHLRLPRLADLTLEACDTVTELSVAGLRLRRLAVLCCHRLDTVAVDASELQAFEYRGAVPETSFLVTTRHGGSGSSTSVAYCVVDICGQEVTSPSELAQLSAFLRLFAGAKHLHLESIRLGSVIDNAAAFATLPAFSSLRDLELRGCLPDDDGEAIVAAVTRLLEHAPNLEALSLVFHPEPLPACDRAHHTYRKEEEIYDKHLLRYNRHSVLAGGGGGEAPSCLRRG
uniref:FBD domain-containing protein n=1 Tax=Oryza brachyantha TaxID=4533 RepID=J3N8U4_ORYBR